MIPDRPVERDIEKRILRNVRFVTRSIAQDGGVVLPAGLRTDIFEAAGEVLARHGIAAGDVRPPNIGRAIAIRTNERYAEIDVQFADTQLGREYAYLYGVNADGENGAGIPYARGWSFGWNDIETSSWGLAQAKRELGEDYDEELLPDAVLKKRSVWVVKRGLLKEVSATPKRADLRSLTRAWEQHSIREAAHLVHAIQMDEAVATIAELTREREMDRTRIAALERDVAALRGKASPPAALGDGGELLRELTALREEIRNNK
jgi:hypothetical protein